MNSTTSILASFATLKGLSDSKNYKNSYQLLSEFIAYIINTHNLVAFSAVEMKNKLANIFGFNIPEAVVKTAAKSLPYVSKTYGDYTVDKSKIIIDTTIEEKLSSSETKSENIIDAIVKYIKSKTAIKETDETAIIQDFIAFLIDDHKNASGKYTDLISEFILKNEDNNEIQECLDNIREGSILYIGINYNINETGSLTKPLTLYLDTEVLFSLAGYNGEIYKTLADDFYHQVRTANLKDKKIYLRYFSEVKNEIDDFFKSAELIIEGKSQSWDSPAMKTIVNGCSTPSDVKVKLADFYSTLKFSYGINEDNKKDYYAEENHPYNLESKEYTDPHAQEGWKFVSHINKLRKGAIICDNTESEYLLVSNTNSTLKVSREQSERLKEIHKLDFISDFVVSLDRITNILWYKLGNGFGRKDYPNNVKSVLKARTILSSCITNNISRVYSETNEQFKNGEITQEQLAARIITLRKKPILPEELFGESIDDSMNFSSEFLSRFEEEVNSNKTALKEKEKTIAEKEKIIQTQLEEKISLEKDKVTLESELAVYRENDAKKEKKKEKIKNIVLFSLNIFWKLAIIVTVIIVAVILERKLESNIPLYVCGTVDLLGLSLTVWVTIKKDFTKFFPKNNKEIDNINYSSSPNDDEK